MGIGEWGISLSHSPLPTPHSLLTYKQLLRVPEREGEDCAGVMIADVLIGRHAYMARDYRDDRQLFSEDLLNLVEGGAAAIGVGFASLCREQIVNPGFPGGRWL